MATRVIVVAVLVGAACLAAKLVLIPLVVAALFAVMLSPIVRALERIRVPRALGAFLVVTGALAIVGLSGAVFYQRTAELARTLPAHSRELRRLVSTMREPVESAQRTAQEVVQPVPPGAPPQAERPIGWRELVAGLGTITQVLIAASFIPILAYFWLSWEPLLLRRTIALFRAPDREPARRALLEAGLMLRRFVLGNLLLAVTMAAVFIPTFWLLGLPFAGEVGLATGFLNLIPYLGILVAPLLPLLAALGHIDAARALITVGAVAVAHLVALDIVYPKLIGRSLALNPLASTAALLVWGWLWGPIGLVLAIPITAMMKIGLDRVAKMRAYGAWLGADGDDPSGSD